MMAEAVGTHVNIFKNLEDNLKLVIQQIRDGETSKISSQKFNPDKYWKHLGEVFKALSLEGTKFSLAFTQPPFPNAKESEGMVTSMEKTVLELVSVFYSLPKTQGTTLRKGLQGAVVEVLESVLALVTSLAQCHPQAGERKQATGVVWEGATSFSSLPQNNCQAVIRTLESTASLVNDALQEVDEPQRRSKCKPTNSSSTQAERRTPTNPYFLTETKQNITHKTEIQIPKKQTKTNQLTDPHPPKKKQKTSKQNQVMKTSTKTSTGLTAYNCDKERQSDSLSRLQSITVEQIASNSGQCEDLFGDEEEAVADNTDAWTEQEREMVGPVKGLVKTATKLLGKAREVTRVKGRCDTDDQVAQLDDLSDCAQRLSPAVDNLISCLYAPIDHTAVRNNATALSDVISNLLSILRHSHMTDEGDQKWLDFLLKANTHNLTTLHHLLDK